MSNLIITKIHSVSTMHIESGMKAKHHSRPAWAVILKYEGETVYSCKGKTYLSDLNNMTILPKGSTYEWQCKKSGRFYTMELECDATFDTIFNFPIQNGEKILKMYKDLEYKLTLKNSVYNAEILRDAYSLLLAVLPNKQKKYQPTDKRQKIAPAVDFIVKNYNRSIKNDELAALTGLSTVYFRKLFTEIFGVSPITYVHALRIRKAKEMLKSDYVTITNVALSLGYPDVYDFSRTFKKHTGVSPLKYLKGQ
ncbi:MAG: helix-turn-helix transcriptional regulator [Clostridia bacterium]|nr:helix-turn-helix transcriptional regulator [Clostridia bacterium]